MAETTDLHHRITEMEHDVKDIKEWKANVSTIIGGLGESIRGVNSGLSDLKGMTEEQNRVIAQQNTVIGETNTTVNHIDRIIRGDLDGKIPGIHSTLTSMNQFVSGIKTVLWVIARALIVALVGGSLTAVLYLIRHTGV
jgi:uncharacterized protein YoxC